MKLFSFSPSQELHDWIHSCSSITQLHFRSLHEFSITKEKGLRSPDEFFHRRGGNAASYHWFLAYCLWKKFKTKTYLVELARFSWRFPFQKILVVAVRRNRTPTYTVFNLHTTHLVYSLQEIPSLFQPFHIKAIYRIPENKLVTFP